MEARVIDFSLMPYKDTRKVEATYLKTSNPATLLYLGKEKRLGLGSAFEDKEVCQDISGAKWNPDWKMWTYPLEYQTVLEVKKRFGSLHMSDNVAKWVERVEQRRAVLMDLKGLEDAEITSPNADKLFPFQRVGVNFGKHARKFLLADDMGLGKTFQSILITEELECKKTLMIGLKACYRTWRKERKKWAPHINLVEIKGSKKRKTKLITEFTEGIMVITYESLNNYMDLLLAIGWDAIILDEAHAIKNYKSKRTIAAKKFKAPVQIALTGTPVLGKATKATRELFSILSWLYPERFRSYWRFIDHYYIYEDGEVRGIKNMNEFRAMLAPIMLRRLKKDVLPELPGKTPYPIAVELYPAERRILKQLEESMVAQLSNGEVISAGIVLTQITRMRQCCISSRLLSSELDETAEEFKSAKLDAVLNFILENQEDHKMVVFTQFKEAIEVFKPMLEQNNIQYREVTGKVTGKKRETALDDFELKPEIRVCLATIQSIGVATDGLQVADRALFIDRYWTEGINEQCEDRLNRQGQASNVLVVNFIAENSVEERILDMLQEKSDLFDDWIEETAVISTEEVRRLFVDAA